MIEIKYHLPEYRNTRKTNYGNPIDEIYNI